MSSFLPTGYEPPASGNYMKFQPGKNRFRVLSAAIVGNVFWKTDGEDRKPVRRRVGEAISPDELEMGKDGKPEKPKHFWSFVVWNYAAHSIQILEITQATIRDAIRSLDEDADWGNPSGYDLNVAKSGDGLDTTYHVNPAPAKPVSPEIAAAIKTSNIDLEALFVGGDPFGGGNTAAQRPLAPVEVWTLEEAVQHAGEAGIPRPNLIAQLKAKGRGGWKPERDTPTVKEMIAEQEALDAFDNMPSAGNTLKKEAEEAFD